MDNLSGLRKVMYPKGRVFHYAEDIEGFQQIRLLCGHIVNRFEMRTTWDPYDDHQRKDCIKCLRVRHKRSE